MYESTWDQFCTLFEMKFIPAYEKAKLKDKYESLIQGTMTIKQYDREFDHLSYYGSTESELDKVHRFKKGLHPSLRHKVGHMQFDAMLDLIICASEVESVNIDICTSNDLRKQKFDAFSRPTTVVPSGFNRAPQITSPAGGSSHQRVGYFDGICHHCGIRGHAKRDCKKFGGGAYVPAAAQPLQTGGFQGQHHQRAQQPQPLQ